MIEINHNPQAKVLAQFGFIWLPASLLLVVMIFTRRFESSLWTVILCAGAGASIVLGLAQPHLLKWVFICLQYLTWPIGFLVSYTLLAIIFFFLITPLGLLLRLFGYDPMDYRKRNGSIWRLRQSMIEQSSYFRQF